MNKWQAEEQRLWDLMQNPSKGRRITLHSIPKSNTEKRKKLTLLILERKRSDERRAWQAYEDLINH